MRWIIYPKRKESIRMSHRLSHTCPPWKKNYWNLIPVNSKYHREIHEVKKMETNTFCSYILDKWQTHWRIHVFFCGVLFFLAAIFVFFFVDNLLLLCVSLVLTADQGEWGKTRRRVWLIICVRVIVLLSPFDLNWLLPASKVFKSIIEKDLRPEKMPNKNLKIFTTK